MAETSERPGVRERILESAVSIAQTTGLESMTQARVAREAGVRQSHLTYYFPTRVDLIKAMFEVVREQIVEENRKAVEQIASSDAKPVDRLRDYLKKELEDPARARMLLSLFMAAREDEKLMAWLTEFEREMLQPVLELFASAGMALDAKYAELTHLFLSGCATMSVFVNSEAANKAIADGIDALMEAIAFQQQRANS